MYPLWGEDQWDRDSAMACMEHLWIYPAYTFVGNEIGFKCYGKYPKIRM
jgi:hypothetical protein